MLPSVVPLLLLAAPAASASAFYWPNVKHVFSFGDSYTDTYSRFVNGTLTASQDYKVRERIHLASEHLLTRSVSQHQAGRCGLNG